MRELQCVMSHHWGIEQTAASRPQLILALGGKAPSTLITITLAVIHSKQTLESLVEFRDCAKTCDVSKTN